MKQVFFKNELKLDEELTSKLTSVINRCMDPEIPTVFSPEAKFNVQTSGTQTDISNYRDWGCCSNLITFIYKYLENILTYSQVAESKKVPPYDLEIQTQICFEESKVQIHIYLDDAVFGLVVGRKFKCVENLIICLYPVMAKMDRYNHEIRFFPYSYIK